MTHPSREPGPDDSSSWLAACADVASILASSRGLEASAPEIVRILGTTLGWDAVTLWLPQPGEVAFRPIATWGGETPAALLADAERRDEALALVRRAWVARRPTTPQDLGPAVTRPFTEALAAAGQQGALAIPLLHGALVHGVIELLRRAPFALNEANTRAADLLGGQIGQFASREEALLALGRVRRELVEVFEEAPLGILVMDARGRILRVNRTGLSILRTIRAKLVGHLWRDLLETRSQADDIWARLEACANERDVVSEEVHMRAGDGTMVWARASLNVARDEDRRLRRVRGFFRAIGTKGEADASRRQSEERYLRLAVAAREYALHSLDEHGAVSSWNVGAERVYGWTKDAILGKNFDVSFTAEDRTRDVPRRMLRLAMDEGEFSHEGWRLRADGSRFWAHVIYTALRDGSGKVLEISQLTRDATQQRRLDALRRRSEDLTLANQEVVRTARHREELLEQVLAALRGPMHEVESAARRLSTGEGAEATTPPVVALLGRLDALGRAVHTIEDLLEPDSPDTDMSPEALDLARLATEARDILRTAAADRQVRVEVDVDPASIDVVADRQMVRQILHNLLSNAIKFSRERGCVKVRVALEGKDQVRIEVEDAGIGLTVEEASRLGARAPAAPEGTAPGLGLAATRRLAEKMGGRFGLASTPGRGSVFHVVLPRTPPPVTPQPPDDVPMNRLSGPVLVVSEHPSTRASLGWTLGSLGLEVVATARGDEALEACRERRFGAVAVDLELGGIGAVDLVTTLRAEGASRDVPWIIPCVGTPQSGGAGLPVADLLPRPVPADRLFAALERAGVGRTREAPVLVVEGDPDLCRGVARTLEILNYRVLPEVDGHAALRACAQEKPAAVVLAPSVRGIDPFSFLHHARRVPGMRDVPVFLMASRDMEPEEEAVLREGAVAAARDGLWLASI